jgi:hypothetical protein
MKTVDCCIVCNSKNLKKYPCKVSPFFAYRIWNKKPFDVNLVYCNDCSFSFYDLRPTEEELGRYYQNYGTPEYQESRQKYEPFFTRELNESLRTGEIEIRKPNADSIIKDNIDIKKIKSVLDFGGDRGQYIPDEFIDIDRCVYEISTRTPLTGIKKIAEIRESEKRKFDFIMCNHVLEHVSYPHDIIDRVMMFAHSGTKFYFELPIDWPLANLSQVNQFFFTHPKIYKIYTELRGRSIEDMCVFVQMTEHINFFSIQSLKTLLELHGLKVEYIAIKEIKLFTQNKLLSCIATMN